MDGAVEAKIAELLTMAAEAFDAGQVELTENILVTLRTVTQTNVEVNKRLGILLANKGDFAGARAPLEDAAARDQSDEAVFFVLSACAFAAEDYEAALAHANRSLKLKRTSPDAHTNRGNALLRLGRAAEALEAFRAAQMLTPRAPGVHLNLANALTALGRHAEALSSLERTLALDPHLATAHVNRANVLQRLGRHAEALAAYDIAAGLDPGSVDAHFNRGLCRLLTGDWAGGWRDYEWRWRRTGREFNFRQFAEPLWLGEQDLAGRTVLLHGEQGLGDCIQFARYVPEVAARGATVILQVYPTLVELFRSLPGVTTLATFGEAVPSFDLHCPLMSLPLALGRPEPLDAAPYLAPPDERTALWAARLGPKAAPRVGLVVSGSTGLGDHRSLSFEALTRHLPTGLDYHLLQKEVREHDRGALAARPDVRVWSEALGDFADTAALTRQMDLVVSIDTGVAHMAGAIGAPARVLLSFDADWRWGLNAEATPWYAGMRLDRQAARGDWSAPLGRLAAELGAMAGGQGADESRSPVCART